MGNRDLSGVRVPPSSQDAEQSLLGSILEDNRAWEAVANLVRPEDFYWPEHAALMRTIGRLIAANKPADVITVCEAGGHELAYVNALVTSVASAANARGYAEIVRERAMRRRMIAIGDELACKAYAVEPNARVDVAAIADQVITALLGLSEGAQRSEPQDLAALLPSFIDYVSDRMEGVDDALETGLADLDRLLCGGLRPGELMVIGARPSMGKTAFVLTLLRLIGARWPVLMMTMEDSLRALISRLVAAAGRINLADVRNPKRAPESMWSGLSEGVDALGRLMIDLDDQPSLTLLDVRRKIQQSKRRRKKLGLVVVDYLQLMDGDGDNRNQSLGAVANGLKRAAKEFDVPVVLLSQLNREADKRPGPPQMSDLRDSGDIEGAADIIGLLYREWQRKPSEENKYHAELHVVKHKNGATDVLNLHFDGALQRFGNWEGPAPSKTARKVERSSKGLG